MYFLKDGNETYLDKLKSYAGKPVFKFGENKILPPEQIEVLLRNVINRNSVNGIVSDSLERYENEKKRILVENIIRRIEDAKNKGILVGLSSMVVSTGGSDTIIGHGKKETQNKGGKTSYVVVESGELAILEPLGQPGNGTFIGKKSDELESKIQILGRNGIILEDVMFKVIHDRRKKLGEIQGVSGNPGRLLYDYESNHFLTLLEIAIDHPKELIDALEKVKQNKKYSNLTTLLSKMPSTTKDVKSKVQKLIQSRGIEGKSVVEAGRQVISSEEMKFNTKAEAGDEAPGLEG